MHKRFSVFVAMDEQGKTSKPEKVVNDSLELSEFLKKIPEGTPVAVEASGGWYWFVDRLEEAGLDVRLVNPLEAKKRMRGRNLVLNRAQRTFCALKRTSWMRRGWRCCCGTGRCRRCGYRPRSCGICAG